MEMSKFGAGLLIVSGTLHTLPTLNLQMSNLLGGNILQILLGVAAIIVGSLALLKQYSYNA